MSTTNIASQLRLAADIIETGHPYEAQAKGSKIWIRSELSPLFWVKKGNPIRLVAAAPPDSRPLHNPDGLTAEQVGAGYRLCVLKELDGRHAPVAQFWNGSLWTPAVAAEVTPKTNFRVTFRLPLSTPWPEAEKPVKPWSLPPPPEGKQWHRLDGWTENDLPSGYRPLLLGEQRQIGDEHPFGHEIPFHKGWFAVDSHPCGGNKAMENWTHCRTRRPLPVEEWADLELSDIPLFSALRFIDNPKDEYAVTAIVHGQLKSYTMTFSLALLRDRLQVNRSLPETGKWDATAWTPCKKLKP